MELVKAWAEKSGATFEVDGQYDGHIMRLLFREGEQEYPLALIGREGRTAKDVEDALFRRYGKLVDISRASSWSWTDTLREKWVETPE